jgi:hypothetical protein
MKILLDECVDWRLSRELQGQDGAPDGLGNDHEW